MKNLKFFLSFFSLLFVLNSGFAQTKAEQKATEQVATLNQQLMAVDPALALTEEQTKKITALYVKRQEGLRDIKKEGGTDEEQQEKKKALFKQTNQQVNQEILTKQQRQAINKKKAEPKEKEN